MFTKVIHTTTLTTDIADRLFSNITASGNAPDCSFLATLRALLHKRLQQNERVYLTCKEVRVSTNEISAVTTSQCMNSWFIPDAVRYQATNSYSVSEHNIFIVHTICQDAGTKMMEIIKANAGTGKRYMSGYKRRDDLKVFYARKADALFYTDTAEQNTVIFTDKLELKHFHALQMMIPKYLPNLFTANPLTETETSLLKSVGSPSSLEYEVLIEEFTKDLDIRSEIIRTKLAGFETVFERMRVDELKNEISGYQNDYNYFITQQREIVIKIQERQYTLAGLECVVKKDAGDSDLMEYFMCNKNLNIIKVYGTVMEFIVHGYADVYDIEAFKQYAGNLNGYLYNNLNPSVTKPQMEMLYNALFGKDIKLKLRICAAYKADMRNGLTAFRHYQFPPDSQTYLPNPHIQSYGCIGTYAGRFQEYLKIKDYVGAIEQATVSARNLNFYDSTVMTVFAETLSRSTAKCIEKSDGTLITPQEAIVELESVRTSNGVIE